MIFYTDDDLDDQLIFKEIAEELHVELMIFNSGMELIKRLENPPPKPAVIFLDINMPGFNGLQILEKIRTNPGWQDIPVIMFTTSIGEEHIEKSQLLGATYYLPKNPDYNELKKSIRFVIEQEWRELKSGEYNFVHAT